MTVCEGSVTEPEYLTDFAQEAQNSLVHVETVGGTGDPRQVVEVAIDLRNDARRRAKKEGPTALYEMVWAVFDRDDHDRYEEACELADEESIQVGLSNPCFELWLLLHFQHQGAHLSCKEAQRALGEVLPDYDKRPQFDKVHPNYREAVRRAKQIRDERRRAGNPRGNPYTGVYRLTEYVRKLGREFQIQERKRARKEAGLS